ncbi:hypothetical protein AVEN_28354-1 [Araneus ventricosus]|uniref:Uncharacterized protein n=1 Tax=Araneus ventricosus TaxID=182803 RepID=A0A4Y2FCX6_ARAVE|nr:hypothetical protein AVEN_28354-1 [Araneus ventricosus]
MDLPEQIRMNITTDNLPPNFENESVESNVVVTIRCNIKSMSDVNEWVKEFGNRTNTKWTAEIHALVEERGDYQDKPIPGHLGRLNTEETSRTVADSGSLRLHPSSLPPGIKSFLD